MPRRLIICSYKSMKSLMLRYPKRRIEPTPYALDGYSSVVVKAEVWILRESDWTLWRCQIDDDERPTILLEPLRQRRGFGGLLKTQKEYAETQLPWWCRLWHAFLRLVEG